MHFWGAFLAPPKLIGTWQFGLSMKRSSRRKVPHPVYSDFEKE